MSQLNAAERRFLENATVIGAQRAIFGKLTSVGVPLRKLGEIAETTSGGTPDRNNSSYYGDQTPWLKSGELTDGLVTEIEETLSEEGLANSNAKAFKKRHGHCRVPEGRATGVASGFGWPISVLLTTRANCDPTASTS